MVLPLTLAAQLHAPSLEPVGLALAHVEGNNNQDHQSHVEVGVKHHHERDDGGGEEGQDIEEKVLYQPDQALDPSVDSCL